MELNPERYSMFVNIKEGDKYYFKSVLNNYKEPGLVDIDLSEMKSSSEKIFPYVVDLFAAFIEDKDSFSIWKANMIIDKEDYYGTDIYTEKAYTCYNKPVMKYNRITRKCEVNFDLKEIGDVVNKDQLIQFIMAVIRNENMFVYNALNSTNRIYFSKNQIMNLLQIIADENVSKIEECIKNLGIDFLTNSLNFESFDLKDSKKLTASLKMPKDVLDFLKNKENSKLYPYFKEICDRNPNDGIFMVKWINLIENKHIEGRLTNSYNTERSVSNIVKITKKYDAVKITKLIPYIFKQHLFVNMLSTHEYFHPMSEQLKEYLDYLSLTEGKEELYPSLLPEAHNRAVKNSKMVLNKDICKKFNTIVADMTKFNYKDENFLIKAPESYIDLVNEGKNLHHCVASYIPMVASGITRVFLLRRVSAPEESFVTVELDNTNTISQIKEKFNQDVEDDEVYKFIDKWVKILTKKGVLK